MIIQLTFTRASLADEALLQEILNATPTYNMNVDGLAAVPGDARDTLTSPPPGCSTDQKHVLLLLEAMNPVGIADVVDGYPDRDTAFIGLLLIREDQQGRGLGNAFYEMIEQMIVDKFGSRRIRIAVIDSNPVVPFWERLGFTMTGEARPHEGKMRISIKRTMEKNLIE